jgi:hypothetical protein
MKRKYILIFICFIFLGSLTWMIFYSNGFLKLIFNEKIWVHRVNSIEKLSEVQADFYGVEVDVVFLDSLNQFDVNHPPEPSIHLTLEEYLSSVKTNKTLHYWLDFKNLNEQNQKKAIDKLDAICTSLTLPKRNFIVESNNVLLLKEFSESGYQISYYLHWPGLYSLNKNELEEKLDKINSELNSFNYQGVLSSDYRDYEIMKIHFSNYDKLLWLDDSFGKQDKFKDRLQLYKMLSDNQVKIVLMKYKSKLKER